MYDFIRFTTEPVKKILKETVEVAQRRGGEWGCIFRICILEKFKKLTDTASEELAEEDLVEMSASKPVPEEKEKSID